MYTLDDIKAMCGNGDCFLAETLLGGLAAICESTNNTPVKDKPVKQCTDACVRKSVQALVKEQFNRGILGTNDLKDAKENYSRLVNSMLRRPHRAYTIDGKQCFFCFPVDQGKASYLAFAFVNPAGRGTGAGKRLLNTCISQAPGRCLILDTHEKNTEMRKCAEACGMIAVQPSSIGMPDNLGILPYVTKEYANTFDVPQEEMK